MSDGEILRLFGLAYLAIGVGILLNPGYYRKMLAEFGNNGAAMYFGGIFALVAGYLLVTYHNFWCGGWTVVITLIGWSAFLKGLIILILPAFFAKITKAMLGNPKFLPWWAAVVCLIGILLTWVGCLVIP